MIAIVPRSCRETQETGSGLESGDLSPIHNSLSVLANGVRINHKAANE